MPIPKQVARLNRVVTNRIARRLAGRVPPFALVHHVGRVSERRYDTPVWMFRSGERFIVALTYGAETDWRRNVTAAGVCDITYRGRTERGLIPELVAADPATMPLPRPVRIALRALGVDQFLLLRRA
jgi:deazaflavin-dependent oxidoreductase (nitroreductase family)